MFCHRIFCYHVRFGSTWAENFIWTRVLEQSAIVPELTYWSLHWPLAEKVKCMIWSIQPFIRQAHFLFCCSRMIPFPMNVIMNNVWNRLDKLSFLRNVICVALRTKENNITLIWKERHNNSQTPQTKFSKNKLITYEIQLSLFLFVLFKNSFKADRNEPWYRFDIGYDSECIDGIYIVSFF